MVPLINRRRPPIQPEKGCDSLARRLGRVLHGEDGLEPHLAERADEAEIHRPLGTVRGRSASFRDSHTLPALAEVKSGRGSVVDLGKGTAAGHDRT